MRCPGCRSPSTSPQPDRTVPHCLSNYCCIHPPPAPCLRAAASPCDCSVRCPCCRSPSTSRSPNHTVLHCSKHRHHWILRPPAPCHWAAASQCAESVRCRACPLPSTSHRPNHSVPRCSRSHYRSLRPPPAPGPTAAASQCDRDVQQPSCQSLSNSDQSLPDSAARLLPPIATVAAPLRISPHPTANAPHRLGVRRLLRSTTALRSSSHAPPCR